MAIKTCTSAVMQKNSFIAIVVVNKIQLKFNFIRDAERGFPLWLNKLLNRTEVFFYSQNTISPLHLYPNSHDSFRCFYAKTWWTVQNSFRCTFDIVAHTGIYITFTNRLGCSGQNDCRICVKKLFSTFVFWTTLILTHLLRMKDPIWILNRIVI